MASPRGWGRIPWGALSPGMQQAVLIPQGEGQPAGAAASEETQWAHSLLPACGTLLGLSHQSQSCGSHRTWRDMAERGLSPSQSSGSEGDTPAEREIQGEGRAAQQTATEAEEGLCQGPASGKVEED